MKRGDVAVSEMKIVFDVGKIDETWKEYNITEAYLKYNDKQTPYKAILKNGRLVAILGRGYQVLPNEVVKQVADEIASRLNAEPLLEKTRLPTEWGNAYFSKDSWKVYLVYTIPEWHEIDGRDRCKIGFAFRNSIDGTLAFSVTGFTYREMCSNGVFMGYRELARFYHKHTKGLKVDMDNIMKATMKVIEAMERVLEAYRKMVELQLNEEIAESIAKSTLPRKLIPPYIKLEGTELVWFDESKTVWDAYNDITARIWHNTRQDITTKNRMYDELHKVLKPVVAVV